jgi:flagellar protein FlbD
MIRLTRFDGSQFYLNAMHVQLVESTPDTHVTLLNGQQYVVREPDWTVSELIMSWQRRIYGPAPVAVEIG